MYSIKELKLKVAFKVVWAALLLGSIPSGSVRQQASSTRTSKTAGNRAYIIVDTYENVCDIFPCLPQEMDH